jgi:glycerol uptake facilitator-like aquaporin
MEYLYAGTFLLAMGALLTYWKYKRAFDRTNEYGVERFSSYGHKLLSWGKDFVIDTLGTLLLSAGLLLVAFHYQDSWGAIVIVAFLIYLFAS